MFPKSNGPIPKQRTSPDPCRVIQNNTLAAHRAIGGSSGRGGLVALWRVVCAVLLALGWGDLDAAEVPLRLANSLGPSMVLQRDMPAPVWGWAPPQSEVTVSFKQQRLTTRADSDGRWRVVLHPLLADASPASLTVEAAGQRVAAENVLVGDVWLCAGPGIPRNSAALPNPKGEIAGAKFPEVRLLRPDSYTSLLPVADIPLPAKWEPVTPEHIGPYSVMWHFGRELYLASGVPVGLILVNQQGGGAEWIAWKQDSSDGLQRNMLRQLREELPRDIERAEAWLFNMERRGANEPVDLLLFPSHIPFAFYGSHPIFGDAYPGYKRHIRYNSNVGPLVPMALRGVLFHCEFEDKFRVAENDLLQVVQSWREAWGRPQLPFVFSEPLLKQGKSPGAEAALSKALSLPGVRKVAKPESFSEAGGEAYWKSVALVANEPAAEEISAVRPQVEWPKPAKVEARAVPDRRKLEAAHVFGNDMVLQCDQPIKVWGWSEPGDTVTVAFAGKSVAGTADTAGCWQVALAPVESTDKPGTLLISGKAETLRFENVLVGEVWVNSGQSNAGFIMSATVGFEDEKPKATNSAIRCFFNTKAANVLPQRRNMGEWRVLSPETVGRMSGMGYYFARAVHAQKRVPIGIIEANHGGSTIFSWTTEAALASSPAFASLTQKQKATREEAARLVPLLRESVREWTAQARQNAALERPMMPFPIDASPVRPFYTSFLQNPGERRGCMFFHTMIQPMIGFGIRGVLWNQGEADGDKAAIYDDLMASMVADWRKHWGRDFPFYYVQMPAKKGLPDLLNMWAAQTRALTKIPNSAMIVCNDIAEPGTPNEVHPRDKKNVGERLARLALSRTYGVAAMVDSSPMMQSVRRDGNEVSVVFSSAGDGLRTRDGNAPDSWELAGADGKYVAASAEIAGGTVRLKAADVEKPLSVRLGWRSDSNCNLVNSAGLPAMPFSTTLEN